MSRWPPPWRLVLLAAGAALASGVRADVAVAVPPGAAPSWRELSLLLSAALAGVGFVMYLRREHPTRREFEDQLAQVRKELDHRKDSISTLGKFVARQERRWHRLDKAIVAIATKLEVDLPEEPDEHDSD